MPHRRASNRRSSAASSTSLLRNKLRDAMNRKRASVTKTSRRNNETGASHEQRTTKRQRCVRTIVPRRDDFVTYVRSISTSGRDRTSTSPALPSMTQQGRILLDMRDRDGTLFEGAGTEGRERVLVALRVTFGVNHRISAHALSKQFVAQNERKAWRDAYFSDCRLGMFDGRVPTIACVTLNRDTRGRRNAEEDTFSRACRELKLKPVRLDAAAILYAKRNVSMDEDPPTYSLKSTDLRRLDVKSLYFQRIYLLQILVYIFACEEVDAATRVAPGNKVILIIDRRLEAMLRLPTTISVLLHGDNLVAISYQ